MVVVEQIDATRLDVSAVAAARSGDRRALDTLVEGYLPLVYSIVGRALPTAADVDDVVQETMVRVVRGIGDLREPRRFRSWLVAIAMNQIREHRRQAHTTLTGLADHDRPDPNAEFVDRALTRLTMSQQRQEIELAARWLQREDRELLSLWALERAGQLTRAELASALELSAHHVTVRVSRMKERLVAARLLVRAFSAEPRCAKLDKEAEDWPGEPTPLWRKRLSRHVGGCRRCRRAGADLVPAEHLLSAMAMLPMPAGYAQHIVSDLHYLAGHAETGMTTSAYPTTALRTHGGAHALRTGPRRFGLRHLPVKSILSAASVVVICAMALLIAFPHLLPGTTTDHTSAAPNTPLPGVGLRNPNPQPSAGIPPSTITSAAPTTTPSTAPGHSAPPPAPVTTTTTTAPPPSPAEQVLALMNKARAAAGLPAYVMDADLVTSATRHNQTMASGCGLSHQCPNEAAIGDRETAAGVHWTSAGENIGDGGPVSNTNTAIASMATGLTQGMLNEQPPDDGHRKNILSRSFTRVGIAVVRDSSGTVWLTQDFAN
ncbi:MAG TPA: sigma-70 family RNA polymerase sigma factor [Pseudonocardiaceae bacterium]|nr:sigma-70 family RNA polymerase sigma factor [Pseudonocardiaceae bacterium]